MKKLLSIILAVTIILSVPVITGATEVYWELEFDKLSDWSGFDNTSAAEWEKCPLTALNVKSSTTASGMVQYDISSEKISVTKLLVPQGKSGWNSGLVFTMPEVTDVFGENAGTYVHEATIRFNKFDISKTNTHSTYFRVGSENGWPNVNEFKIYSDGINDGNSSATAAFNVPIADGDTVTFSFECDTVSKQTRVYYTNGDNDKQLVMTRGFKYHNTSSGYQINKFRTFSVEMNDLLAKDTTYDILDVKIYKNPSAPVVEAESIKFFGDAYAGKTLTVQYDYQDGAKEKNSLIEWYTADDENGTNPVTVKEETYSEGDDISKLQYVIDASDVGKYLFAKITPKSAARTEPKANVGEPVEKMLSYIGTASDMPKAGDIKEINGKEYYVAQVYNFDNSELPKGVNIITNGDARYEVVNGALEFVKNNSADKIEAYIRMFEHDGSYAAIKADEILVGADITVDSENGTPVFEFNTIDNNNTKIAGGGYITDENDVDKFYVNYADKKGNLQSSFENYFDGIEKSVLMKMDFVNQQVSYDVNSLEKLAPDYAINKFQDLYGFSMKFASGDNSAGTVKVDNIYVYVPVDNLLDTAFDAFCEFADFSDTKVNTVSGDVTLPYTSFLNTALEWESSDPTVISSNGTTGSFAEDREVTLTAKLTCKAIENDYRTKAFKFVLLSDMGENLLSEAQLSGSTNGGKITAAADNDLNTSWSSAANDKEPYIQYNIKAVKPLNKVRIYGKNIGSVKIQTSADGSSFKDVLNVTADDETKVITDFLVEEAQYVKLLLTAKDSSLPVEVSESGIYFEPTWADKILLDYNHPNVDIPYMPKSDLKLPTVGTYGSTITWTSDFPEIISNDGTITHPVSDTLVTLTSVISAPDGSAESKTLTYKILIEGKIETIYPGTSNPNWGGAGGGGGSSRPSSSVSGGGNTVVTPPVVPAEKFSDLNTAEWAREYINKLYEKSVISGYPDGTFRPNGEIAREEFLKIAVEAFGIKADTDTNLPFADVSENEWYFGYIKAAYNAGIIKGISESEFGIGNPVSRQDMAVILSNIIKYTGKSFEKGEKAKLNDEESFADYAKDAINALLEYGILNGDENGKFNPLNGATRAEICKVICVMISEA